MKEEKEWKEWITRSLTIDEMVNLGPSFVKHICIVASTGGAATTLVYDGIDTNGKLTLALSAIASTHFSDQFSIPVFFSNGIFVDIGSNVTLFVIQFKSAEEK